MKWPKYNLTYSTRDQLQSLALKAGERKHQPDLLLEKTKLEKFMKLMVYNLFTENVNKFSIMLN